MDLKDHRNADTTRILFPSNSHQCFSLSQISILLETATFLPEEQAFDISSPHLEKDYFSSLNPIFKFPGKDQRASLGQISPHVNKETSSIIGSLHQSNTVSMRRGAVPAKGELCCFWKKDSGAEQTKEVHLMCSWQASCSRGGCLRCLVCCNLLNV